MSKQMNKQIDKHMNKRLAVLKKGQIDMLEVLYGCRFGGCWLFWVGLGYPPEYTYLTKPPFRVTMKTMSSLERKYSNNNHNDTHEVPLRNRLRTRIAAGMLAVAAAFGVSSLSHEGNTDNAPQQELACVSEETTFAGIHDTTNELTERVAKDGKEYSWPVMIYDRPTENMRYRETNGMSVDEDARVEVTVCRDDNALYNLYARVNSLESYPKESDQ